MSQARSVFLQRFNTLAVTLAENYVQDGALHEEDRNSKARLIRNGLAVVGFSYLEDFFRQRTSEVLASISASAVPFGNLPEKVKEACTYGLLKAVQARVGLMPDSASKIGFAQDHARLLASTSGAPYQLSELSFGYKGSNINADEIGDILRSFRVTGPWLAIGLLASKVGLSSLSLEDAFVNAAKRRHRAAHVAGAITPYGDLMSFVSEAKAIAFGFDALLSSALVKIRRRDTAYFGGGSVLGADVVVTLIFEQDGRYKEKAWGALRARATAPSIVMLEIGAIPRAETTGAALVVLGRSGQLVSWSFPAAF